MPHQHQQIPLQTNLKSDSPQSRLKNLCIQNAQVWMGIINLSPLSFSQSENDSTFGSQILKRAQTLIKNGAHILDFGAVPTNPNIANCLIEPHKEFDILYPVLHSIKKEFGTSVLISVDTYSPAVAYTLANENLIDIVNDIYGGRKIENLTLNSENRSDLQMNMMDVVAQFSLGYVLMHMSGELDTLPSSNFMVRAVKPRAKLKRQSNLKPQDDRNTFEYLANMLQFFAERKSLLTQKGINFCVFDPGIGGGRFGKNLELNLALLSEEFIQKLKEFGFPILIGLSRKSFLRELYPELIKPESRDEVSKEWEMCVFGRGANIIRTHKIY